MSGTPEGRELAASQQWVVLGCGIVLLGSGCAIETFPEVEYLALGDSITGTLETDTYPRFLIDQLAVDAHTFAAEGQGGRTTAEGRRRLEQIAKFNVYPNLHTVILWLGGADMIDFMTSHDPGLASAPSETAYPFDQQLDSLLDGLSVELATCIELARQQKWRILLLTYYDLPAGVEPCPAFGAPLSLLEASRAAEYVALLNERIENLAAATGTELVDLRRINEMLSSNPGNFADCIHPSRAGSQIIAQDVAMSITP